MTKLIVENLQLSYDTTQILKGVSFQLKAGEVMSLLGASGGGKTTLLRAVAGLEQASSGRILLDGKPLFDSEAGVDLPVEQRSLGLVFQSYALWPHRTVAENVGYGLKLRKVPAAEIKERVQAVLDQLGLGHLAARFPYQLSGGQQQRVAIARALVYNPPVILLDEPLSNLDAKLREEARAWLRELIVSLNLSALCVTHDQTEAMAMSDQILLLKDGRIEQQGSPAEMYTNPKSLFVADFMGNNNRLTGTVAEIRSGTARVDGDGWSLWGTLRGDAKVGSQATAMIRLERVKLADVGGHNHLQLPLITSMYLGDRWEYLFHPGKERIRAYGDRPLAPGAHWVQLPAEDVWVFA
jgi:iron(III) transport system ATP-binding protein